MELCNDQQTARVRTTTSTMGHGGIKPRQMVYCTNYENQRLNSNSRQAWPVGGLTYILSLKFFFFFFNSALYPPYEVTTDVFLPVDEAFCSKLPIFRTMDSINVGSDSESGSATDSPCSLRRLHTVRVAVV